MTAIVGFDVEGCCWAASGWEDAPEGSIRDARTTTRGQAAAFVGRESNGITEVRVWKRYIRPFTLEESWRYRAYNAYQGHQDDPMPQGWQPDECDPQWDFVHRSNPEAIPVWVVGFKGDKPPKNPEAPTPQGASDV